MQSGVDFVRRGRAARESATRGGDSRSSHVQMYTEPPTETISLLEFEEVAMQRLKVLRAMDELKERCARSSDEFNVLLGRQLDTLMPVATSRAKCKLFSHHLDQGSAMEPSALAEANRRDIISHFVLRLAFCRSPEQTKWFIAQEMDLFRFRFQLEFQVLKGDIDAFLLSSRFNCIKLTDNVRNALIRDLSSGNALSIDQVSILHFWKVPFVDALDLVRKRRVLLRNGYAFVSLLDLSVIVSAQFRLNMATAMARASKYISFIEEEDRLMPLLNKLTNKSYIGKDYLTNGDSRIKPAMIESLYGISFPLCMRRIHERLRSDHHLRHGARLQYGLFLKGIGLSLEDALAFWKAEFTKKMDPDKFDRQYAYNVRHSYGKEGRRADYPPFPCTKIILGSAPAALDCHGCPFRHTEPQLLTQKLESMSLSKDQVKTIVSLSKSSLFDRACTRQFEFSHGMAEGALGQLITHPNQYFELSRQIVEGKRSRDSETVSATAQQQQSLPSSFSSSQ